MIFDKDTFFKTDWSLNVKISPKVGTHQLRESQSYIIVGCNINNLLSDFDSEAKDVMNNIAPLRTTIITGYFILPWYNHYIHITKTTAKDS